MQAKVAPPEPNATDLEHLKLLAIFHYIMGALVILFACLGLVYVVLGTIILVAPDTLAENGKPPMDALFGALFLMVGLFITLGGWIFGAWSSTQVAA
jgi:hypothetical protein